MSGLYRTRENFVWGNQHLSCEATTKFLNRKIQVDGAIGNQALRHDMCVCRYRAPLITRFNSFSSYAAHFLCYYCFIHVGIFMTKSHEDRGVLLDERGRTVMHHAINLIFAQNCKIAKLLHV